MAEMEEELETEDEWESSQANQPHSACNFLFYFLYRYQNSKAFSRCVKIFLLSRITYSQHPQLVVVLSKYWEKSSSTAMYAVANTCLTIGGGNSGDRYRQRGENFLPIPNDVMIQRTSSYPVVGKFHRQSFRVLITTVVMKADLSTAPDVNRGPLG